MLQQHKFSQCQFGQNSFLSYSNKWSQLRSFCDWLLISQFAYLATVPLINVCQTGLTELSITHIPVHASLLIFGVIPRSACEAASSGISHDQGYCAQPSVHTYSTCIYYSHSIPYVLAVSTCEGHKHLYSITYHHITTEFLSDPTTRTKEWLNTHHQQSFPACGNRW